MNLSGVTINCISIMILIFKGQETKYPTSQWHVTHKLPPKFISLKVFITRDPDFLPGEWARLRPSEAQSSADCAPPWARPDLVLPQVCGSWLPPFSIFVLCPPYPTPSCMALHGYQVVLVSFSFLFAFSWALRELIYPVGCLKPFSFTQTYPFLSNQALKRQLLIH